MSRIEERPVNGNVSIKVPALFCSSGSSSAECSSSEESAGAPYASEHSEPRAADDGYEADVEVSKLELSMSMKTKKQTDLLLLSDVSNIQAQDVIRMDCPENKGGEMVHPELCIIVVDILSQLIDKVLGGDGAQAGEVSRVCGVLARAWAARGARAPRLLRRLLAPGAPAARLLAVANPAHTELQRSVLELVQAAGAHSLEAGELAALLRPLSAPSPPLALLLAALTALLARARPHTPDHILSFPVDPDPDPDPETAEEPTSSSFAQQAELTARRLRQAHLRAGSWSPWAAGGARAALGGGWAPWLQGFAAALWLRLHPAPAAEEAKEWQDEPPDPDEGLRSPRKEAPSSDYMHVFSIGHDSLMFELWINTTNGSVSVRLSRPDATGSKLVSVGRVRTELAAGARWRCLALNVLEHVHKRRIHIQVTIYVDGRECETLSLPLQGILVRKATPCSLLLGQAGGAGGAGGALHLGGLRVFRAPVLAAPAALHLAAHGPDLPCQIPCESANFPSIITPELLELNVDWDSVYEISSQTLRELQDNLLLTFYPHAPGIINLYHQPSTVPTVFGGRAAGGGEAPEALRVRWLGVPRASAHRGAAPALLALGGPDLLLYLYARTVELRASGPEQARALALLLRACGADARLAAQLHAGALELLLPVLAARHALVSHHVLKVILDEACSSPILLPSGSAGSDVTLLVRNDSILLEPRLLLLLMRAWRHFDTDEEVVWEEEGARARGSVWLLAIAALSSLLRPAHAHRAFNHYQACRVDLLRHMLHACKERFLHSSRPALSGPCSARLVALIRALLGAPPPLPHLALLADFLLLMHQASDTFVTHSRANFYFLLTPDTPETSDFNFLNFINKRRKSSTKADNKRLYDTMERSSSSSVSSEVIGELQLHDNGPHDHGPSDQVLHDKEPLNQEPPDKELPDKKSPDKESPEHVPPDPSANDQGLSGDAESNTDHDSTSDSTKQLKGLINMQIKIRRKQSSSSENYDLATEKSAENTEGGTEKVVEETTVPSAADSTEQLYSGSIYQQVPNYPHTSKCE